MLCLLPLLLYRNNRSHVVFVCVCVFMSFLCVCVCVYVIFMGLCVCVCVCSWVSLLYYISFDLEVLLYKCVLYICHYMFGLLCTECRVIIFFNYFWLLACNFNYFFQQQKAVDVYLFDVYELLYTAGCRPQAGYFSNCDCLGHNSGVCTVLCRLCFNSSGWF